MQEGVMIFTVVRQKSLATFDSKKPGGGQTTLYEVEAVDEAGEVVGEPLRSFAELPIGEALEYEVKRYVHMKHGVSWTLHKPRENLGRRVTRLEKLTQDLADRVSALEGA